MSDMLVTCRSRWPGRPDRAVEVAPDTDLFSALRRGGMPIASSCTGRRVCGRCVVAVLHGHAGRAEAEERAILAREAAAPNERLACRLVPREPGLVVTAGYW